MANKDLEPIHYWRAGTGPAILLIHGGLSNGELAFRRTAEALAARRSVIVVDRRGHGKSPSASWYTIAGDAEDMLQMLERLEQGSVHIVGHSYGAVVALEMACIQPNVARSLHLIEPPLLAVAADVEPVAALQSASIALWKKAPKLTAEEVAERFLTLVAGAEFVASLQARPVWTQLVAEARRLPREENPADKRIDFLEKLPSELPVTVYTGGRSHPALQIVAERLAKAIPGAHLVRYADAYHEVHKIGGPFLEVLLSGTKEWA